MTKIENFRQFWPKSRYFENFDEIRDFYKFWTKIEIFSNFDQNRDFFKFWPKSSIFDNFDQNQDFRHILLKFSWKFFTKSTYLQILYPNWHFCEMLTKNKIWVKFRPKSILPKILTKIKIFWKCWPRSRFHDIFINIDLTRNYPTILTKIEIFKNFDPNRHFFENFDYNQHFLQFCPKSRFS